MNQHPVTEAELHAFVDGLLPPARHAEIQAYLDARPEEAQRLAAYRKQNEALRDLFNPVMSEPIPARLTTMPRERSWMLQRLVAGLAIAFFSGGAGWLLHGQLGPQTTIAKIPASSPAAPLQQAAGLARQAAIAHVVYSPDIKRPVEIGADQEEQLVTWLSKRIGSKIQPPKLGKLGYELMGGRLLPGESGPVAQFMYHDAAGQRLTLYVSTEQSQNRDTGFRFAQEGPVNVFYWIDGKFGYALSAGTGKTELARIAGAVHEQIGGAS